MKTEIKILRTSAGRTVAQYVLRDHLLSLVQAESNNTFTRYIRSSMHREWRDKAVAGIVERLEKITWLAKYNLPTIENVGNDYERKSLQ